MSNNEVVGTIKLQIAGDKQVISQLKAATAEQKNLLKAMEEMTRAQASMRRVQADIAAIGGKSKEATAIVKQLDGVIDELGRQKSLVSLAGHFAQVAKATGDTNKQAKLLFDTLKQIGATRNDIE